MGSCPSQPPKLCLNSFTGKSHFEDVVSLGSAGGSRFNSEELTACEWGLWGCPSWRREWKWPESQCPSVGENGGFKTECWKHASYRPNIIKELEGVIIMLAVKVPTPHPNSFKVKGSSFFEAI